MESNNANEPAFPSSNFLPGQDVLRAPPLGLTKREYFAGLAMQGIMKTWSIPCGPCKAMSDAAYTAVNMADALLAELEKTNAK